MRNSFLIYTEYEKYFDMLSPEEQSKLIKGLFISFRNEDTSNIESSMEGMTKMAFAFMETQLKSDAKKYKEKCEQNRENANSRNRKPPIANATERNRTQQDIDKDLDIDLENNIVDDDIPSTNITHTRACEETTTSTTLYEAEKELKSLCKDLIIDCGFDLHKYDLLLLIQKVKESRYLKLFRSLSDLLNKYDYIIADKYKDFVLDKLEKTSNKSAKTRTYTKEEYDAMFTDIYSIEI